MKTLKFLFVFMSFIMSKILQTYQQLWITLWISEERAVGKSGITWWIIHKDIHKMAEHKEFPM